MLTYTRVTSTPASRQERRILSPKESFPTAVSSLQLTPWRARFSIMFLVTPPAEVCI